MKTAISVPQPVFDEVERAAKRLKISRSEFYTRAAKQMLESVREQDVTRSYDEAFTERADGPLRDAARAALLAVEWDET